MVDGAGNRGGAREGVFSLALGAFFTRAMGGGASKKDGGEDAVPALERISARWTSSASLTENTTFCGGLRYKLRKQVEKPLGWFAITVNLAILIATLTMILETLPERKSASDAILAFEVIEFVCVAIFTLELLIKIAVSPPRALGRLICSFMTLVDVGAITPFYLNLVIQEPQCWTGVPALLNGNAWPPLPPECDNALTAFAFLRTIRLLRVVRVLKLGNFSAGVKVFSIAIGMIQNEKKIRTVSYTHLTLPTKA